MHNSSVLYVCWHDLRLWTEVDSWRWLWAQSNPSSHWCNHAKNRLLYKAGGLSGLGDTEGLSSWESPQFCNGFPWTCASSWPRPRWKRGKGSCSAHRGSSAQVCHCFQNHPLHPSPILITFPSCPVSPTPPSAGPNFFSEWWVILWTLHQNYSILFCTV